MSIVDASVAGVGGLDPLWGACRMESADCEAFGVEAIADALRHAPFPEEATSFSHGALEARIASGQAMLIERNGTVIVRIWRIGMRASGLGEKGVMVPFDTDLGQARRDVFADIADPGLRDAAVGHARAVLAGLEAFRSRAFVMRAAGDARDGLALYQVYTLSAGRTHRPMQARALARWHGADVTLIVDQPWPHGDLVRLVN
jgi:hypothetical protein